MLILIAAVASASLLGSMHCVGMCGPLAIWASGSGETNDRRKIAAAAGLYHFGRMVTYALAGLIAGAAGGLLDLGGEALGIQLVAARVVGSLMVLIGGWRLWQLLRPKSTSQVFSQAKPAAPSLVTRVLVRLRPYVFQLPLLTKGFATGLLTAFLPCGWLYLFALVAAGTGSVVTGPVVMLAFWVGTVPALIGLVAGTQMLAVRFRKLVPAIAAGLLVIGGCYTAAGRGFAQLNSLADIRTNSRLAGPVPNQRLNENEGGESDDALNVVSEMQILVDTPLPCCVEKSKNLATQESTSR